MAHGPLPEFDRPPVAEVALAIAFEELPDFTSAHLGLIWQRFRTAFPRTEDHPPVEFPMELPPDVDQIDRGPRLEFLRKPKVRCWFLNEDGTQLIQLQSDRFIHNWRKQRADAPYPHYDAVRHSFVRELRTFEDYIAESRLGELKPKQCEVTYVNHIRPGPKPHTAVSQVVNLWCAQAGTQFLPSIEDARFSARYTLSNAQGKFVGRLNVSLQPAYMIENREEILNLTLVARGVPLEPTLEGALAFLDLGHEWIVRGFAEITTADMHRAWGRRR